MHQYTYIVIPAKDEETRIGQVLHSAKHCGFYNIVVVDDGSCDQTAKVAIDQGAEVVRHPINLGPGAATQTGIDFAIQQGAKFIVTIDADEQHYPKDIQALVDKLISDDLDIVIGSRFLSPNKIPFTRILFNKIANVVAHMATGVRVSDSQSGMKAFTSEFAQKSKLQHSGFEFCVELLRYIGVHKAKYAEVPIQVMYSKETMEKGQNFFVGLKMLNKIFRLF